MLQELQLHIVLEVECLFMSKWLVICEADGITIAVQTVWLQEERGLSLCRLVAGTIGSAVGLKR